MSQLQKSNVTFRGRHVRIMRDVARALNVSGAIEPRVLSFGCSTGDECLDLAAVMPDAAIFGCEIKPAMVANATQNCEGVAAIFQSSPAAMLRHGLFDAVFALNVFLNYPAQSGLDDVSSAHPFASFDEGLASIDAALKPGGVLALYNGQYFLEDAAVGAKYRPFLEGAQDGNAWIEKALPDGRRATNCFYTFEGETRDRATWSAWLKQGDNRQRAMINGFEKMEFRHEWIDPAQAEGRSTRHAVWIKQA